MVPQSDDTRKRISAAALKEFRKLSVEASGLLVPEKFREFVPDFSELEVRQVKDSTHFYYHYSPGFFGNDTDRVCFMYYIFN